LLVAFFCCVISQLENSEAFFPEPNGKGEVQALVKNFEERVYGFPPLPVTCEMGENINGHTRITPALNQKPLKKSNIQLHYMIR